MSQYFINNDNAPGTVDIVTITGNSGGAVPPNASGNINILGTAPITVTGSIGSNTLTISLSGAGFVWSDQSISFPALANNGYFLTAALTAALPASPSNGDTIEFITTTASTILILANTGQTLYNGSMASSVAGTLSASAIGNSLELIYRSTDQSWRSLSVNGTWGIA